MLITGTNRTRMSPCSRLVAPPLEPTPDDLCLPADTDQDCSASPLERGDHSVSSRKRHIQPCPTRHTMKFHIDNFIGTGALIRAHRSSLSLRWYADYQLIASSGRRESMHSWTRGDHLQTLRCNRWPAHRLHITSASTSLFACDKDA